MSTLHDFTATTLSGGEQPLSAYAGKVVLVVNTASECGLTPQYEGLEELYQRLRDSGLVILGFPSNQFGGQEPGSDEDIAEFCQANYGVSFPMFTKGDVNGPGAQSLFTWLKESVGDGSDIEWNFAKFLIGRDGAPIARFSPRATPADIEDDVVHALNR